MSNLLNISGWSGSDQTLLKSILDQVIPASQDGRIPSAGALPRVADYLSAKINNDTALDQLFRRGLTQANNIASAAFDTLDVDAQRAVVEQLEASEPAFFESLLRHIYMAYYSNTFAN